MRVNGDNNQISEDVFDLMISYLLFPQKSIRSELVKLFPISIYDANYMYILLHHTVGRLRHKTNACDSDVKFPVGFDKLTWKRLFYYYISFTVYTNYRHWYI